MRGLSSADERSHEGRSSFALGRAVLPPAGGVGGRGTWLLFMGWGQEGQPGAGLAPRGACSACPCSVWLCTELTSPGLYDIMHYVIIIKM